MYADYDDNEVGALDCEEIEGHVLENSDILLKYAQDFENEQKRETLNKSAMLSELETYQDSEDSEEEMMALEVREKEKWDCESILSTYSNIYNHPKLIKEPKIHVNKKTGIPLNILDHNKLTKKALDQFNEVHQGCQTEGPKSVISQLSYLSIRPKDETPEGRRERKRLLKAYKKERREEKKANSLAFKEEAKKQVKIMINQQNNVQGNKIF